MACSGILRRVAPVRTDVSEEFNAFIITVTKIGELGTTLVLPSNRRTLRKNTKHCRENLKSCKNTSLAEWCLLGCYAVKTSSLTKTPH
jgi:hypothetical protein